MTRSIVTARRLARALSVTMFAGPLLPAATLAQAYRAPATAASPSGGSLPAARDVIARYVKAIGGREALVRHTSMHSTGTFEVTGAGLRGTMEAFAASPNKTLVRLTLPGLGEIRQGFDGEVGWTIDPTSGPTLLEGRQLAERRQDSDFLAMLHEPSKFSALETLERVTFEGKQALRVKLTRTSGESYHEFFDEETGLLVGSIVARETPMGALTVTNVMSDYRSFGGILMPTRITQKGDAGEIVITTATVEFDKVAPGTFELPGEIKALR